MTLRSNIVAKIGVSVALCLLFAGLVMAQEPRTATITFTKPTKYVDGTDIEPGTVITYNVYQGAKGVCTLSNGNLNAGCNKAKVATITATATTINTGLQPGETCWQVTAVANGKESALSNEGCKTFDWPETEAVIITVT